jgi:sulfite reductase alpha subunit-like flavoprotein
MAETDRGRSALVLYGTETGTSQDLAEEIGRCLERLYFYTDVSGLDTVNYARLSGYSLTVFVVATTGQGDFPDNARKFWTSLLRKKLTSTTLNGISYALVGLGDSSYPKFNWAARKLDKRLRQLGASEIIQSCEADEQGDEGTDGAFLAWLQGFQDRILQKYPLSEGEDPIPTSVLLPSKWRLERVPGNEDAAMSTAVNGNDTSFQPHESGLPDSFPVTLDLNQRVTPADHWQDVRFINLRATKQIEYLPGDAIAILPHNMPADVESLITRMSWKDVADSPMRLAANTQHPRASQIHVPQNAPLSRRNLTLRRLLTEFLDINAIPRRSFFGCIANYTNDEMHKERLLEFTDPQWLDEYYDYATRPRRSILEILQEFDSVHLPWEEVTNIFPPMRPRQFSVASGGLLKSMEDGATKFELLVAIVKYRTVIKRIREGVCTRYLAQLPTGTVLNVSLKTEGRFAKKSDLPNTPHILIGAGTGIAPLRALIHEKIANGTSPQPTALFFGCRNKDSDNFFAHEWETVRQEHRGVLNVQTAFSRDQKAKVYVQDRIREQSDLIWDYLRRRHATIIVCGSSGQMPRAVRQALVDAMVAVSEKRRAAKEGSAIDSNGEGSIDESQENDEIADEDEDDEPISSQTDAERYLAALEKENRYKQETWS